MDKEPQRGDFKANPALAPFLVEHDGRYYVKVPASRFCASLIVWIVVAIGLAKSISESTIVRWFKEHKIKPWQFRSWITPICIDTFLRGALPILELYSRIPLFGEYEEAWSVDEKTSIQVRSRASYEATSDGEPARIENTYVRNGVVQLYSALNVAKGLIRAKVTEGNESKCFIQFAQFLKALAEHSISQGKRVIHFLLDNASIHRPKSLESWLEANLEIPAGVQILVHWLPVRSSWLNQIEIWFSILQAKVLTPNFYKNIQALEQAILDFVTLYNLTARAFRWKYTADELYRKYGRELFPTIWPAGPGASIW